MRTTCVSLARCFRAQGRAPPRLHCKIMITFNNNNGNIPPPFRCTRVQRIRFYRVCTTVSNGQAHLARSIAHTRRHRVHDVVYHARRTRGTVLEANESRSIMCLAMVFARFAGMANSRSVARLCEPLKANIKTQPVAPDPKAIQVLVKRDETWPPVEQRLGSEPNSIRVARKMLDK